MELKMNKTEEYTFLEAWEKAIDENNLIITSKSSGVSYKIDMLEKENKLRYYNPTIGTWQICSYVEPKEIFCGWYVTRIERG